MKMKHFSRYLCSSLCLLGLLSVKAAWSQVQNTALKINQIQVIGSHNSYKKPVNPLIFDYYAQRDTTVLHRLRNIEYEHIPILAQLDLGLRNIEIDAYADPEGGRFASPKIMQLVSGLPKYDPEGKMKNTGFKVIHIPDIDFQSWYFSLEDCLKDLRYWSDKNPGHTPVFITFEAKDGRESAMGTQVHPYTVPLFDQLDSLFLTVLGKDKLICPDDVRKGFSSLNEAVKKGNWPTVEAAKGKFLIIFDDKGRKRDLYTTNHPSLEGQAMFTNAEPGSPESATLIINDPGAAEIPKLVKQGYIIRTRADSETIEARTNDFSRFEKAKESGAQIITTDYYLKSNFFKSDYVVRFGINQYERENP